MINKWVKFIRIDKKINKMYVPPGILTNMKLAVNLYFGKNKIKVRLITDQGLTKEGEFNDPVIIKCSGAILDELMIQETLTYQLKTNEDGIHIGPVIGFLMGEQQYYYHDRFLKELKDAMGIYEEIGGLFIVFKTTGIDWKEGHVFGLYYEPGNKQWKYGKLPFPSVIFRRSFLREGVEIEKLKTITDGKIFNTFKLDKLEIYEKLKNNNSFHCYLPPTSILEKIQIFNEFIAQHQKVILKPKGLSRGRGICIIETIDRELFKIYDYRESNKKVSIVKNNKILEFLIKNKFLNKDYLIQPYLELANIDGNVFDIRVVMQKNIEGEWECTGIECRVAGKGINITNISIGGKALTLENTIRMAFRDELEVEKVRQEIINISKIFCSIMDENDGIFAEYGLDIGIDVYANYWFIEANFRPAFKGFQLLDYNIYYDICYNTVRYAVSLAGFENRRGKNESEI